MAVTVEELAIALRLEAVTPAQTANLTRLLGVGEAHVALLIPAAPTAIKSECIVRLCTYLHDAPVGRRDAYANAWINSGAGALASRFKPQAASGSTGVVLTPGDGAAGTGLSESEVAALIEVHRDLSEAHHVPGTGGGGLTDSQVSALIQAHRDIDDAHHTPGTGGGGGTTDTVAREAAAAAQQAADSAAAVAAGKDDAFDWATVGNNDTMPAAKHRLAIEGARGAVAGAVTNELVDAETDGAIRGWGVTHIIRLITRKVEAWARKGANTLIPPAALFGVNHATNRLVAISTEGAFQLIEGGGEDGGGDPLEVTKATYQTVLAGALAEMDPWQTGSGSPIITVAHGLSRQPDFYETYIECVVPTSSDGYSLGDRIPNVHTPWRITVRSDGTNTYLISSNTGSRFGIADLDSGRSSDDFTASQWKFAAAPYIFVDTEVVTEVTGGGGGGGDGIDASLIEPFAIIGNTTDVPYGKMPFVLPPYILDPLNHPDIPYSAMDGTVESWAIKDASPPIEIIPNARLPVARFLPSPTGLADGRVATIASGAWTAAESSGGSGVAAKQWRFDFKRGEDTADPIAAAGMVFIELRYLDSYNSEGVRTSVQDVGAGFLAADGSRTLSSSQALDIKGLLAQSSVAAVMNLVTVLPVLADAVWGEWYGLADIDGQVEDVHYLRQQNTTEQTWIPARLDSMNRDLHGFNDLDVLGTYGYERGGALSPEAEIVQLVEEKDSNGNITTRLLIPATSPLTSGISVLLFYKSGSQEYTSAREIPLFRDATITGTTHRYVTAVTTGEFRFTPGVPYTIKWRNAGSVNDLVLHSDKRLVRVADEYDVLDVKGEIQQEIYTVEDRVAALESAPAAPVGGGFPTNRSQVLSATATTLNTARTPTEAWIASQLYELEIGGEETFLFLTKASGAQVINYDDTRAAANMVALGIDRQPSIRVGITIGATTTMVAYTDAATGATQTVIINKLT